MEYEVEQKHLITDTSALEERLTELGAMIGPPALQFDQYFVHPCRDFAQTDEALRIRTVGERSFVTYKGPKLDSATKIRHELEFNLGTSDAERSQFAELLHLLGFRPLAVVRKSRRKFELESNGQRVQGALDDVDQVGTYVELELLAADTGVDEARRAVANLAIELGLISPERRSYLEMLLENMAKLAPN